MWNKKVDHHWKQLCPWCLSWDCQKLTQYDWWFDLEFLAPFTRSDSKSQQNTSMERHRTKHLWLRDSTGKVSTSITAILSFKGTSRSFNISEARIFHHTQLVENKIVTFSLHLNFRRSLRNSHLLSSLDLECHFLQSFHPNHLRCNFQKFLCEEFVSYYFSNAKVDKFTLLSNLWRKLKHPQLQKLLSCCGILQTFCWEKPPPSLCKKKLFKNHRDRWTNLERIGILTYNSTFSIQQSNNLMS